MDRQGVPGRDRGGESPPSGPTTDLVVNPRKISDSEVNSFVRCPQAWHFSYVMGIKVAPAWALTGRSAHAAEEINYKQKIDSHEDISLSDALDVASQTYEQEYQKGEVMLDEGESKGSVKDRTILAVETYHTQIAPTVQPVMVEEGVQLLLPWGTTLKGRIDVVDDTTRIRDTKHVSYKPREGEDTYQTQPGVYGWMYQQMMGEIPKFVFDYVILGRKQGNSRAAGTTHTLETVIDQARIDRAIQRVQKVEQAIQSGVVYGVANPFTCGGCGYRKMCPWVAK